MHYKVGKKYQEQQIRRVEEDLLDLELA